MNNKENGINAAEIFRKAFPDLGDEPFALYGLGVQTGKILEAFPKLNIIGLLDNVRTGDTVFGKKVLSDDEVLAAGIKKIIIIASRVNTQIIYRRIAKFCKDNDIAIFDINGVRLPENRQAGFDFSAYRDITAENLKRKIDNADAVSFDIFDTLIMRNTLYPTDVFYFGGEDFVKARITAERELLSKGDNPSIYAIYEKLCAAFPFTPEDEMAAEIKTLSPRTEVAACLEYARKIGKEVYLTSDMYYPKAEMQVLLSASGIDIPTDNILVSCDFGANKGSGLFEILKSRNPGKRILHIGDNEEADIEAAKRFGIDDTFYVPSAVKMLEDSYAKEVLDYCGTLENRTMIGLFAANALKNPFLFAETGGKFSSDSVYEMAYTFIAPLVWVFFCKMIKTAEEHSITTILLGARDGYLINEIYKRFKGKIKMPRMEYFLISRALAVGAMIKTEKDITETAVLPFSGSAEEMLKIRFDVKNPLPRLDNESDNNYILRHSEEILAISKTKRERYLRYIDSFGLGKDENIAFFDLVSSGTCQKALECILARKLTGIYFVEIEQYNGWKTRPEIVSVFGTSTPYNSGLKFMDFYFLLENIVSSFDPTIIEFDNDISPIYITDGRTKKQLEELRIMQEAVLCYCEDNEISPEAWQSIDERIPDLFFSCVMPRHYDKTNAFITEKQYDEFANRVF
jgi:FMN phosphatase YigB (HAD superfamily)